jgi:FixJ family two-component response regulator
MGAKHALLILDDDSAVRASLKFYLEIEGFEVSAYSSAHELLNEDSLPASSCLVVDYHMPTMNGLEVVAQLRDRHILNPAILSSQRNFAQPCRCGGNFNCREATAWRSFIGLHPQGF